ncbi:MAG: ATP synthase subunit delta [Leptospiraceae bacterium]|nr:MAG: ATP synthase subunit delta [Leptospiraceae bacterium]
MIFEQLPESYAKALLDLTKGKEEETLEYIKDIQQIIKKDKQIEHFFLNPTISKNLKIEIIKKTFKEYLPEILLNFLCVLAKNDRIELLPKIEEIYRYYYDQENNIVPVKVITAIEVDQNTKEELEKVLEKYFNKKVDVKYIIKPQIIGGIVIQSQGYEIDNSVLTKLRYIYKNLKNTKISGVVYED